MKEVHTSGNRKDGYVNTLNGVQVGSTYATQKEAREAGRKLAKEEKAEHFLHDTRTGQIRERNSYGNDPPESKG
jgi:hypothetical protein